MTEDRIFRARKQSTMYKLPKTIFKKEVNEMGFKTKKLPSCIAFVDFEHWYIGLERQYGVKPDLQAWKEELSKNYEVEEIAVFGDFSNSGLRG